MTWQIVSGLGSAAAFSSDGLSYPTPFNQFVLSIEVFMLDLFTFFHAECVASTNYSQKLALALITVVALGVIAVVSGKVEIRIRGREAARSQLLLSPFIKYYVVLIYMILPMMSSMAVRVFHCKEVS